MLQSKHHSSDVWSGVLCGRIIYLIPTKKLVLWTQQTYHGTAQSPESQPVMKETELIRPGITSRPPNGPPDTSGFRMQERFARRAAWWPQAGQRLRWGGKESPCSPVLGLPRGSPSSGSEKRGAGAPQVLEAGKGESGFPALQVFCD